MEDTESWTSSSSLEQTAPCRNNMRFTVQRYESVPMLSSAPSSPAPGNDPSTPPAPNTLAPAPLSPLATSTGAIHSPRLNSETLPRRASDIPRSVTDGASGFYTTMDQDREAGGKSGGGRGSFIHSIAHRGRVYAKRHRRRLVNKSGDCNIIITNVSSRRRNYIVDIFTTMLDVKWRYNILVFVLAFVGSWFLFAFIWWVISRVHNDHQHIDDPDWTMCMSNVYDFPSALLFSIETQHTIGYGFRSMETKCPEAFIVLMVQSALGVFMQSVVTGLIFAKISRPKARARTVLFSRHAVICKRDGDVCLMFRIGDMRKSHIVGTQIRAIMVQNRLTKEGEIIPVCQVPLTVETETALPGDNYIFLAWPVTVVHKINKASPLWNISAEELLEEKFEIVVILDGTIESSGMTTQLRTSYLPTEILWGHHLAPLVAYQKEDGLYYVDFTMFHNTIPIEMHECSASNYYSQVAERVKSPSYRDKDTKHFTFTAATPEENPKLKKKRLTRALFKRQNGGLQRSFSDKHCTTRRSPKTPHRLMVPSPLSHHKLQGHTMENIKELQVPPIKEDPVTKQASGENDASTGVSGDIVNDLLQPSPLPDGTRG